MTRSFITSLITVALIGCSNNSQVLREIKEQKAAVEKQQQVIAEMSKSMQAIEARDRQSQSALSAKDAENRELARKLASAQTRIEQEARRPTFNVEEPKITIQRSQTPAVHKKSADLIIQSVDVYSTRDNGSVWDKSGPPDLKVYVGTATDDFTTTTKHDTHTASYGVKTIRVSEGDTLEVIVYDTDFAFDDRISSYSKLITAETLSQGIVKWSFGRVSELVLKFEP